MGGIVTTAAENLISPIVLSFALGFGAATARSDLSFPEAIAKGLSLYLLFSIGFKGGASVAAHGADLRLVAALIVGALLSLALPFGSGSRASPTVFSLFAISSQFSASVFMI